MQRRRVLAAVLIIALVGSSCVFAGPAQEILEDLSKSEQSARLATAFTYIGLGVVVSGVSAAVLMDSGIGIYGVIAGGVIALPGVVSLAVRSSAEREFARVGDSEIESALALERLAAEGRLGRIISGLGNLAAGVASLLYPFSYFTRYDYVYSAVMSFGTAAVDFLFLSKEERAYKRYEALAY